MGGFHFERPATNQPLLPNESLQALLKHQNITPDLYWERYGLVIEYDGAVHFSADGVREDKRRVFDYQAMELVVLPATAEDIRTVDSFDAFARTVSRVMERVDGPSLRRRVNKILADKDDILNGEIIMPYGWKFDENGYPVRAHEFKPRDVGSDIVDITNSNGTNFHWLKTPMSAKGGKNPKYADDPEVGMQNADWV